MKIPPKISVWNHLLCCFGLISLFAAATANSQLSLVKKQSGELPPSPHFLTTNHLWLLPASSMQISLGVEARSDWQAPLSGLQGRLLRLGVMRVDFGASSNVVIQIRGAIRQQLEIDEISSQPKAGFPASGTTADAGDFSVGTIVRLAQNAAQTTAFGMRAETRLPNSTQKKGIGTNTTDVFLATMLSQKFEKFLLFGEFGMGILTAPVETDEQNDVLTYGLGVSYLASPRLQFAGEISGYLTTRNIIPVGTEARGVARAGVSWLLKSLNLELSATRGLTVNEGTWGGNVGLNYRLNF